MADTDNTNADELISQFMSFTGSTDPKKAASYLEMCGNNLDTAVGMYMEHEQGGGDMFSAATSGGGGGGSAVGPGAGGHGGSGGGGLLGDDIRAPDQTRTMRLMDDDHHHHGAMMGMGGAMFRGLSNDPAYHLMQSLMDMEDPNAAQSSAFAAPASSSSRSNNNRAVLDAAIAAQGQGVRISQGDEKENDDEADEDGDYDMVSSSAGAAAASSRPTEPPSLSDMFAAPNHLIHRAGGFQGARTMAKDTKRWLLVNIQRDAEFASHALNRDVWRDELVENLIREGFIFWQVFDSQPEGRTYSERYQVHDYPHIGIIDPRTGRLLWRKEGWSQQNPVTAETFAEIVTDFCSRNSFDKPPQAPRPPGASATAQPAAHRPGAKRSMDEMSEEEQLRAAMQASMAEAGAAEDDDDGDGDGDVEYDDDDNVGGDDDDDEVQVVDSKAPAVEEKEATLNDELQAFVVPDEPTEGNKVQLRLPSGKRSVRMFSPTDPVRAIYAFFAQSDDEARGGREFTLKAGYPPRDLLKEMDDSLDLSGLKDVAITVHWK